MNLEKLEVKKLEVIFSAKYDALKCDAEQNTGLKIDRRRDFWVDYCDRHNIEIMRPEWVKECFNEKGNVICISMPCVSPENDYDFWLLVPKKMAEKVLVLGYLP